MSTAANPWEKYQSQGQAPWEKYQTAPEVIPTSTETPGVTATLAAPQLKPLLGFTPRNLASNAATGLKELGQGIVGMGKEVLYPQGNTETERLKDIANKLVFQPADVEAQKARTAPTALESIGHSVASAIPVLGPWAASLGEQAGTSDVGGAIARGGTQALATELQVPEMLKEPGSMMNKPALIEASRDMMANELDKTHAQLKAGAAVGYDKIRAADEADTASKTEAHRKARADAVEKLRTWKPTETEKLPPKAPARPQIGLPVEDIFGAINEKLGNISADTRAKLPKVEAAAKEVEATMATAPDFAHVQALRSQLYNLAQSTTDNYERSALMSGYQKATDMLKERADELGHSDTFEKANKKYALSAAIRDAREGSPKPVEAYRKLADVTDKEIGDVIKKAGVEGEQFKGQLESLKPLAAIQKPHGALGRLAVFKEHPAAALAGSAIGGTVLGSIVPGVGHFMGMYGGALGAGELADRLAAVKALRERGALASAK